MIKIEELNRKAIQEPENMSLVYELHKFLRLGQGIDFCWPIARWFYGWAYENIDQTLIWGKIHKNIMKSKNTIANFPFRFDQEYISKTLFSNISCHEKYKILPMFDRMKLNLEEAEKCFLKYDNPLIVFNSKIRYFGKNYRAELRRIEENVIKKEGLREEYKRIEILTNEYNELVYYYGQKEAGLIWYDNRRQEHIKANPRNVVLNLNDKIYIYEDAYGHPKAYHPDCFFPFYEILQSRNNKERLSDFTIDDAIGEWIYDASDEEEWENNKKKEMANEFFGTDFGVYDDYEEREGFDYNDMARIDWDFEQVKEDLKKVAIEEYLDQSVISDILESIDYEEMTVLEYLQQDHEDWINDGIVYSESDNIYPDEWQDSSPKGIWNSLCNVNGRHRETPYPLCRKTYIIKVDTYPFTIEELFGSSS